jgi:tetratricopeptide (TPR) repeat protein
VRIPPRATAVVAIVVAVLASTGCRVGASAALTAADHEFAAGHFERALEHYQRAERSRPQDPAALFGIGVSLYRQRRYDEAIAAFQAAAARFDSPTDRARALHNLGNALALKQRFDEALDAYRQALRLDDRESTRLNYLLIRSRLGQSSDGAAARRATAKLPNDNGLFEVARQFDAPAPQRRPRRGSGQPPAEW